MTDITDQVARALSANWRNVHTNEALGFQRMLAAVAVLAVRAADRDAGMVLVRRDDLGAAFEELNEWCDFVEMNLRHRAAYANARDRLRAALEAS